MWLYYAFTAVVALFKSVVRRPLDPNTTFHMALISGIQDVCRAYPYSAGARRIARVASLMDKMGFDLIKARSRKRAMEHQSSEDGPEKRGRFGDEPYPLADTAPPVSSHGTHTEALLNGAGDEDEMANLPSTFVWEDWEEFLHYPLADNEP